MTLAAGLYKSQDQQEDDLTNGPGWTIDDQKPGMFDNLAKALPRGVGQGVAAGISVLAKGLQFPETQSDMDAVMSGPAAAARATQGKTALEPWQEGYNAHLVDASDAAREFSKTLIPDPRITGSAANLVQGFGKAATEFTVGSLAGGPLAGATLLGASEGYGHYQDLLDSGVDEQTATKSGLLTAMTSGGSALLPSLGRPSWRRGRDQHEFWGRFPVRERQDSDGCRVPGAGRTGTTVGRDEPLDRCDHRRLLWRARGLARA
jgi:hypothetical protein